jgi:cell division transport system permease protein
VTAVHTQRSGPLLPGGQASDAGLVFVVAVLCLFACLTGLGALAGDRAARGWGQDLQGSATVIVRPKGGETADAAQAHAAAVLAGVTGVDEARALEKEKAEALVRPWLGGGDLPDDLPIPRLVAVELNPSAPATAARLDQALKAANIDATVDDHSLWTRQIMDAGRTTRMAALGAGLLMAAAAAAVIAFATRSALEARRAAIEVLHLAGAEDRFIAGLVMARFARMAAGAGLFAAVAAAIIGAIARAIGGGEGLTPVLPIAWSDLLWLALCPPSAALVAAIAARVSALRLLKDIA